jgi:hypothetical protein
MESRFGHDFSFVRVHTDVRAGEAAQAINALAYNVGKDMVFRLQQFYRILYKDSDYWHMSWHT